MSRNGLQDETEKDGSHRTLPVVLYNNNPSPTTMSATSKFLKVIILGAPGSGKGTISNRIVRDFGVGYFSVGDCLRDHMKKGSEIGVEAKKFILAGTLVPDKLINQLVIGELLENYANRSWLLDGFPRSRPQANELWSRTELRPHSVINLVVPDEEIIERVKYRWIHPSSGRIYHDLYNPPKKPKIDDVTGEPLVQRDDDREEVVKARLKEFHARNNEIVDLFR